MKTNSFVLDFPDGLPKGTAQQKGEAIRYKVVNGKRVPYIQHYKKASVETMRRIFELKLKPYRPVKPSDKPIALAVIVYFDVKDRKLWGKFKTTRPDCDNYVKELKDSMTSVGFWEDDAQVCVLNVSKRYAETGHIFIHWEEIGANG